MLTGEKAADELVKAPDRHFKNHNPKPLCALRRDWKWWFRYNFEQFLLCLKSYLYNYHPIKSEYGKSSSPKPDSPHKTYDFRFPAQQQVQSLSGNLDHYQILSHVRDLSYTLSSLDSFRSELIPVGVGKDKGGASLFSLWP